MTRQIHVGGVLVGGGAPVTIQSMCNTPTQDVEATVEQIRRLEAAGCEIIRVAVPDMDAAQAVGEIKKRISIPWPVSSPAVMLCASTRGILAPEKRSRRWWKPVKEKTFPSVSGSMGALWRRTYLPSTAT